MNIENGLTVEDKITGFKGVVTGLCYYITGCNQALVQPKAKTDAERAEPHWFDFQRLIIVADVEKVVLANGSTPGFDKAAPKR